MTKTDLKQIATSREIILALFFMAAILFLFMRILYAPKAKDIAALKGEIKTLRTQKEAMVKFIDAVAKQPPSEIPPAASDLDPRTAVILGQKEPEISDIASLMAKVTEADFLQGTRLDAFKFLDSSQEKGYSKRAFVLEARGTFAGVFSFVEKIEKLPALVSTDALSLEEDPERAGEVQLKLEGTLYQTKGGDPPKEDKKQ
ncbi:MAG: type 4a pilus biogenesis protein PilO [Deltaproteobacteria bacterium]|nr:type 4a pilus biogenesis protein PilO [Deltaproteobacteria bacterium]